MTEPREPETVPEAEVDRPEVAGPDTGAWRPVNAPAPAEPVDAETGDEPTLVQDVAPEPVPEPAPESVEPVEEPVEEPAATEPEPEPEPAAEPETEPEAEPEAEPQPEPEAEPRVEATDDEPTAVVEEPEPEPEPEPLVDRVESVDSEPTAVVAEEPDATEPTAVIHSEPTDVVTDGPTEVVEASEAVENEATEVVADEPTEVVENEPTEVVATEPTEVVATEPTAVVGSEPTAVVPASEPTVVVPTPGLTDSATQQLTLGGEPEPGVPSDGIFRPASPTSGPSPEPTRFEPLSEEEQKLAAERAARRDARTAALAAPAPVPLVAPAPVVVHKRTNDKFWGALGLFLLRIVLAGIFAIRGLNILTDIPAAQAQFARTIIPQPEIMAIVTGVAAELIALSLLLGLLTRLAGLGIALIAGGALAFVYWSPNWSPFVPGQSGFLGEYELLLAVVGVLLLLIGGGGWSLDRSFRAGRERDKQERAAASA
ncbi:MAG: DoxX family membrane protein [Actinobacteria bacterium]|nr:DoxX family membrane protein [Actinomycetota bacterium]